MTYAIERDSFFDGGDWAGFFEPFDLFFFDEDLVGNRIHDLF